MTGPAIYDPDGHQRITRDPAPDEARAIRDLIRAVRRAAAQVVAEQERERMRRGA